MNDDEDMSQPGQPTVVAEPPTPLRARHPHVVAAIVAAVVLVGIALTPLAWSAFTDKADDGQWTLKEGPNPVPSGLTITIDGSSISGQAPCNDFSASWSEDEGIVGPGLVTTDMGCPGAIGLQEATYYKVLAQVTTVEVDDDELVLEGPHGRLTYERLTD